MKDSSKINGIWCFYLWTIMLMFGAIFFGCESPEIAPTIVQCVVTNHLSDTYNYQCQDGTYRCTNADGSMKYKDCWYGDAYCVEACR
jgi:hypothetical protein